MPADTLSNDDLTRLYTWVDEIKLSRPKRNIARDFSDGVLVAEVRKKKRRKGYADVVTVQTNCCSTPFALFMKAADLQLGRVALSTATQSRGTDTACFRGVCVCVCRCVQPVCYVPAMRWICEGYLPQYQ